MLPNVLPMWPTVQWVHVNVSPGPTSAACISS